MEKTAISVTIFTIPAGRMTNIESCWLMKQMLMGGNIWMSGNLVPEN